MKVLKTNVIFYKMPVITSPINRINMINSSQFLPCLQQNQSYLTKALPHTTCLPSNSNYSCPAESFQNTLSAHPNIF